ncbi:DUF5018 domain-containing protein [Mesonia ostreae]|uniref:DUF5018 domain-containing protein n=1 Tax=Mesonia ostreae TaxID=861110 RepID=A0ABU2KGM6_9FLAO|nr:DUF5018 domain-containing protein [Mesonia ostreae]MDT0293866.1 DUF5018 domain-containing protein [Mesonia ostreae]
MKIKIKLSVLLLFSLILTNCAKDDEQKLSSENQILSFKIIENENEYSGVINQSNKTINIMVSDLDLSNPITPKIEISENASISPSDRISQNFSDSVEYTVTAENGNEVIYSVRVGSSDNEITSFSITPIDTTYSGVINHVDKTILIEAQGLELNNTLIPNIEYSPNASISPSSSQEQDFSENIEYTVTAHNGEQATYNVITNNTPLSNEKKILSFQLIIDDEIFEGVINHATRTIEVETNKNPNNISPIITISNGALISPDITEPQNFEDIVEYTITAENQTSNVYRIKTKVFSFFTMNVANSTNDIATKYYSNAIPIVKASFVDLTIPDSKLILENDQNSYELTFSDYYSSTYNDILLTSFKIEFPQNIVTASNYKLKYKVGDIVKCVSNFEIDVLAENVPEITSINQTSFSFMDTLILVGNDLVPGLRVLAHNGTIYQYNQSYVSVNPDATQLTFPIHINSYMFPSVVGQSSPHPTPIIIYYNQRYGEGVVVDFN